MKNVPSEKRIEFEIDRFFSGHGRRPRVLISRLARKNPGREMNEVSPRQTATCFAQYGFDVDIAPDHMSPEQLVKMAVDNDVHLLCLLSTGEPGMAILDSLSNALRRFSCDDVQVVFCPGSPSKPFSNDRPPGATGPLRINPGDAEDILRLLEKLNETL